MAWTQIKHIKHTIMTQKMTQFNLKSSVGHSDNIYFWSERHDENVRYSRNCPNLAYFQKFGPSLHQALRTCLNSVPFHHFHEAFGSRSMNPWEYKPQGHSKVGPVWQRALEVKIIKRFWSLLCIQTIFQVHQNLKLKNRASFLFLFSIRPKSKHNFYCQEPKNSFFLTIQ